MSGRLEYPSSVMKTTVVAKWLDKPEIIVGDHTKLYMNTITFHKKGFLSRFPSWDPEYPVFVFGVYEGSFGFPCANAIMNVINKNPHELYELILIESEKYSDEDLKNVEISTLCNNFNMPQFQ